MSAPVLLYLVTEDWYFLSHRLPMAYAAQRRGYDVHVATHINGRAAEIEKHGFRLHALDWRRGSMNPADLLRIVAQVRHVYKDVKPDLVHHVALQPSIIGSLAALGLPMARLNALAGLGYGFTSRSARTPVLRPVLSALLRLLMNRPGSAVLVQNPDDLAAMAALGIARERIHLVAGSGVDTQGLKPLPEPPPPLTVGYAGRLLADKGLRALVAAYDLLAARGQDIRLVIAGEADPANPTSIPQTEVEEWRRRPGVELPGHLADIRTLWGRVHIAVLPSRREGLPKSLLEAAACGRPIVATDVPGCREIARAGLNALLVPPDDPERLADALQALANDAALRRRFGAAGRELVEAEFSEARIGDEMAAIYGLLLEGRRRLLPRTAGGG